MWDGVKDCEQIKLGSKRSLTWGSNGNNRSHVLALLTFCSLYARDLI